MRARVELPLVTLYPPEAAKKAQARSQRRDWTGRDFSSIPKETLRRLRAFEASTWAKFKPMRRNAMTRAPILSAVAAALLLGFTAAIPAAAEDASSTSAVSNSNLAHAVRDTGSGQGRIRQFLRHGAC